MRNEGKIKIKSDRLTDRKFEIERIMTVKRGEKWNKLRNRQRKKRSER